MENFSSREERDGENMIVLRMRSYKGDLRV